MKIREVAEKLGCSELTVRVGLQKGVFPFGAAFKVDDESKHFTYVIYPEKVKEYVGE